MSKEELEKYEMINQSGFKMEGQMNEMQSKFYSKYVKMKGWDIANLTTEQTKEIKSQPGFKNPGMILG